MEEQAEGHEALLRSVVEVTLDLLPGDVPSRYDPSAGGTDILEPSCGLGVETFDLQRHSGHGCHRVKTVGATQQRSTVIHRSHDAAGRHEVSATPAVLRVRGRRSPILVDKGIRFIRPTEQADRVVAECLGHGGLKIHVAALDVDHEVGELGPAPQAMHTGQPRSHRHEREEHQCGAGDDVAAEDGVAEPEIHGACARHQGPETGNGEDYPRSRITLRSPVGASMPHQCREGSHRRRCQPRRRRQHLPVQTGRVGDPWNGGVTHLNRIHQ